MALSFGVTVLPDPPYSRFLELIRHAEASGFQYGWTYDSHVLWQESFPLLTMAVQATTSMKFGHCVTNPGTREPTVLASAYATLHDISDGRMVMGIGRGDSSRRVVGLKPVRVAEFERRLAMIKDLMNGRGVSWNDKQLKLEWVRPELPEIPMWVAGYGPKALKCAGRIGDGVILQFADPHLIKWCLGFVREGAEEARRDFSKIRVMSAAPVWVSDDLATARDHVRWFPALVSNHVVDLVSRYKPEELPPELTDYIQDRKGYNYLHHAEVGSSNAEFVTDDIVDRFAIVGPADEQVRRLQELIDVGVTQFNIYLMSGDGEETVKAYGRDVVPRLRD